MADITSFLQNGQVPAGSALTSTTSTTSLPAWYTNYAQQIISNQNAAAAQPYQTYQGPRVAGFNPTQTQAFNATKTAATAFQPGLNAAQATTNAAAAAPGALTTAQPWLNQAGQSSVANIDQYMNPYTTDVVNRIGELGARNLSENLMPAITSKYINAGQLGYGPHEGGYGTPSGMMTDTARAVRDTNADILAQQTAALEKGYSEAAGLSAADLSRYGTMAGTAGNLADTSARTGLAAGAAQADIAGLQQKYGLTGASAVGNVGQQQQALTQQNYDTAYQDFLRQQGWTQQQINNMTGTLQAVAPAIPKATTEQGIVPAGTSQPIAPSDISTIAGTASTLAGLAGKLNLFGLGGA